MTAIGIQLLANITNCNGVVGVVGLYEVIRK